MKKFDLDNIGKLKAIENELELEKALAIQGKLRWMAKKDPTLEPLRVHLRGLIKTYEAAHWSDDAAISNEQIEANERAVRMVELEQLFLEHRKAKIQAAMKGKDLLQKDLALILDHPKGYMSELMNGVRPFSKVDLIIIHNLFEIPLKFLIPPYIAPDHLEKLKARLDKLNNPSLTWKAMLGNLAA